MCRLQNIALESVTEKCDRRTERQSDPYVSLCFAGNTKMKFEELIWHLDRYSGTFCQTQANFNSFAGMSNTFRYLCPNVHSLSVYSITVF